MNKTLSIVIPVFDEGGTLEEILDNVLKADIGELKKEIIIVDDFSKDGTRDMLKSLKRDGVKVFFNEKNRGKGFSVRCGLKESTGDFVIIQDADLEYSPEEYGKLLEPLVKGETDMVFGSRFLGKPFVWKTYYLANRFLTAFSNIFTGFNLTDMETCYKCFNRSALDQVLPKLNSDRFDIEPEITAIVARLKLKITEVPISYNRRSYEQGKKIGWKDGIQAIWAIIKFNL